MEFQIYEAPDAFEAIDKHRESCEDCKNATSIRNACDEVKMLHDEIVLASRAKYQADAPQGIASL